MNFGESTHLSATELAKTNRNPNFFSKTKQAKRSSCTAKTTTPNSMPSTASTTTSSSKLEALARARAWRDQRCSTPPRSTPTSAKKAKKTSESNDHGGVTNESPRRVLARSPPGTTRVTLTPKQEAKERALIRARDFASRLKEKKEQLIPLEHEDNIMDIDNGIDESGIPAVINIEDGNLSNVSTTTVHKSDISAAEMEEMKRIAADMKKLSERLEAVANKNNGCN
eukprot:scaffold162_cov143-Skeletonema_menzelii.AAC.11